MYSRQEASQLRQEFWTAFGQYMLPVLSADGERVNWINYKTGERHVAFKMNADKKKASIGIEISHPDPDIQQLYFLQFQELKTFFDAAVNEEWIWQLHTYDDNGRLISRIYTEIEGVNIFKKEDWPQLITFFKHRMIALDDLWSAVRYSFESLR